MTSEEIVEKRVSIAITALKNVRQLSTDPLMRKIADDAIGEIINIRLAPAPSEAPQKVCQGFVSGADGKCVWDGHEESEHKFWLGAPSEAKPATELKSEQAEEEFYKWWQPKTLIGGRFHGYSENWGAKDAWVAARSEPPAEASREGK